MAWADKANEMVERFGCLIVPLWPTGLPVTKLDAAKHLDLPASKLPSKDPKIIEDWSNRFEAYGVLVGTKFLVVDIDIKDGQNGKANAQFLFDNGLPKETYTVQSPSGGRHLYYNLPKHYTPAQGAGHRVLFKDDKRQIEWDKLNAEIESTGIDTRFGNGYVVGPGSKTKKGLYKVLRDLPLNDIPESMMIGRKGSIAIAKAKQLKEEEFGQLGKKVKKNRNNDALGFTLMLRRKGLPEDWARVLVQSRLGDYDGDGAPTFEEMWSMYERAGSYLDNNDVVTKLMMEKIFITKGEKILDITTNDIISLTEFETLHRNAMVPVEISKPNGDSTTKMRNPADLFMEDVDRPTVQSVIYDPRMSHGIVWGNETEGYMEGYYFNTFRRALYDSFEKTKLGEEMFEACIEVFRSVFTSREDYDWFMKWFGIMVMDPVFRPCWHFHIFSETRGVGKDTLASIIRYMYGERNCAFFNTDIFTGQFNNDIFTHGLGILSDFTPVAPLKSSTALSSFKQITGTTNFRVRKMYSEAAQAPLNIRFLLLSNSGSDFPIDEGDRRLYKVRCTNREKLCPKSARLTHIMVNKASMSLGQLHKYGLGDVTDEDIGYARWKLYNYLAESGWEKMYEQQDCPVTDTKREFMKQSTVRYIIDIQRLIDHHAFVFQLDFLTKEMLGCVLKKIKCDTKVETVWQELISKGMLLPCFGKRSKNSDKPVKSLYKGFGLDYDPDTDMIVEIGTERTSQEVRCVRNFEYWENPENSKPYGKQLKTLCGVAGISTKAVNNKFDPTTNIHVLYE